MVFIVIFFPRKDIDELVTLENDWDLAHCHTFIILLINKYLIISTSCWFIFVFLNIDLFFFFNKTMNLWNLSWNVTEIGSFDFLQRT